MSVRLDSVREFHVAADTGAVWDALARVGDYPRWWNWLRHFDGTRLAAGERWRCTVRPMVPYALRFVIELREVEPGERVAAGVSGDLVGQAALTLESVTTGTRVRLTASLAPQSRVARGVAVVLPGLARAGHDRVLDDGVRRFRREVVG